MTTVTATELQNNFGKYLNLVIKGNEIVITKKGKEVARIISKEQTVSFLTDSLKGVLKHDYDDKKIREERILKHESIDWYQCCFRRSL